MFGKKSKQYYEMSKQQFEELQQFYRTLGYTEEQVKKLSQKCFGANVKVSVKESYHEGWTFYRNAERDCNPMLLCGAARNSVNSRGMMGMAMCGSAPMMEDAMPAPMMERAMEIPCAGPMMNPTQPDTAETHDVPENETHSPLDASQLIFSANVNTASWTYLRNKIIHHDSVEPSFVRIEEIINSYDYDLPAPSKDVLFMVSDIMKQKNIQTPVRYSHLDIIRKFAVEH